MDVEKRMAEIEQRPTVYCKGYNVLYHKNDVPWLLAELRRTRQALTKLAEDPFLSPEANAEFARSALTQEGREP